MKLAFASFSPRSATLAPISDRRGPAHPAVTRAAIVELFGAELYGQRRFHA